MGQSRFRALITLDAAAGHRPAAHAAAVQYPNHTHGLMVRVHRLDWPAVVRLFPTEVCWDDDRPLCPGDSAVVTITVTDEEADSYFGAGQRFALWSGDDIGHGVVSRKVFTEYGPS